MEAVEEWATARRQKPRRGRGVVLEEVHKEIGVLGAAAARGVQMVRADVGARLGPVVYAWGVPSPEAQKYGPQDSHGAVTGPPAGS